MGAMSGPRVAMITGASGGLGGAIAIELAAQGLDLVLVGRSADALETVAAAIAAGQPALRLRIEVCDLRHEAAIRELGSQLAAAGLAPDVLINNAAVQGPIGRFADVSWSEWSATLAVDLAAPALLTKLMLPAMIARGWGRVINISGGGATGPRPDFSAYAVAKTALVRLTETLAHELAGSGVTVNAVAPGAMNTRMLDEVLQAGSARAPAEYGAALARARTGGVPPAEAARLVAWLVSPASARVTGRLLSAVWDAWPELDAHLDALEGSDVYTLRRIVPRDRGYEWGER
jgi:3-oxoacyl-[acyl-carrier protein] reductase